MWAWTAEQGSEMQRRESRLNMVGAEKQHERMNEEFREGPERWSRTFGGKRSCGVVFEMLAEASPGCSVSPLEYSRLDWPPQGSSWENHCKAGDGLDKNGEGAAEQVSEGIGKPLQ